MTDDRDPEIQQQVNRAVRELARRLHPWVTGMADLDGFCRAFVEDLLAERWRVPLAPPPDWRTGHGRPGADPNDEWRQAREQMRGDTR